MAKMIKHGVGFAEEEEFLIHEEKKLKGKNDNFWKERKGILALIMERKFRDNNLLEGNLRKQRDQARKMMSEALGENSSRCRRIVKNSKDEGVRMRKVCYQKNMRKLNTLVTKYGMRRRDEVTLCEEDWEIYKDTDEMV